MSICGSCQKNELRPGLVRGGEGGVGLDKNCYVNIFVEKKDDILP